MVVVLLAYFVYLALMPFNTPSLNSMSLVTGEVDAPFVPSLPPSADSFLPAADDRAHRLPPRQYLSDPSPIFAFARPNAVPEAVDVPLGMACAMIYGRRKRPGEGADGGKRGSGGVVARSSSSRIAALNL